jgi:mannosyltransferase OCH1-like enzyme
MDTWQEKLPDYEIILWDTKRFDINNVLWVKQAFEVQLYACAADYIRLYAIYIHGGIYLDMEVVKSFDPLLDTDILLAYENHISENIEACCFGAEPAHPYIKNA